MQDFNNQGPGGPQGPGGMNNDPNMGPPGGPMDNNMGGPPPGMGGPGGPGGPMGGPPPGGPMDNSMGMNQQPPQTDMMGNSLDPMGGPPGGPGGPMGDPMCNNMGGPGGPMDPMMGGPGGPMGPPGMDPGGMMGGPGPDGFFESSEYSKHLNTTTTHHPITTTTTTGSTTTNMINSREDSSNSRKSMMVPRQDSASSVDLDLTSVSVKRIEDRADEYASVKQALLNDLTLEAGPGNDSLAGQLSPHPGDLHPELLPAQPTVTKPKPNPAPMNRQRSRDNLRSIFGQPTSPMSNRAELSSLNTQRQHQLGSAGNNVMEAAGSSSESRSSPFSSNTNHHSATTVAPTISCSTVSTTTIPSLNYQSSSLLRMNNNTTNNNRQPDKHDTVDSSQSQPIKPRMHGNHLPVMVEEAFPVCLSPELELLGKVPGTGPGPDILARKSQAKGPESLVFPIPEVPEKEEEGSNHLISRRGTGKNRQTKVLLEYNYVNANHSKKQTSHYKHFTFKIRQPMLVCFDFTFTLAHV